LRVNAAVSDRMERHRVAGSLMSTAGRAYTTVASVSRLNIAIRRLELCLWDRRKLRRPP
jgi:hypothetical protein